MRVTSFDLSATQNQSRKGGNPHFPFLHHHHQTQSRSSKTVRGEVETLLEKNRRQPNLKNQVDEMTEAAWHI